MYLGNSVCIRAMAVILEQSACICAIEGCIREKVVCICAKWGKGCIRAKVVVFAQSGCIRGKVVVFGAKVVVFAQKWL